MTNAGSATCGGHAPDPERDPCLATGAYLGARAWPRDWAERIDYRDELLALGAPWDG